MNDNSVIIIEPSSSGLALISAANAIGIKTIVLTYNNDDRVIPEYYLKQANVVIETETNNEKNLLYVVNKIAKKTCILGIIPGFEYYVPLAARISSYLKLRGLPIDTVECLRFKDKMRQRLKSNGIAIPCYMELQSVKCVDYIADQVGYPCVIKPINSSGSIHVSKVHNRPEAEKAYLALCNDDHLDMGFSLGHRALAEKYIEGTEFSIEGYVQGDKVYFISITEKLLGKEPFFIEAGHIVSANLEKATQTLLYQYAESVVRALNITMGVFHCEVRLSQQGPIVMELGARLPGDNICDLIAYSRQINFPEIMIKNYLGLPINLDNIQIIRYAGVIFFLLEHSNVFNSISGLDVLKKIKGFQRFELLKNPGQLINHNNGSLSRVAKAIFTADNYQSIKKIMTQSQEIIKFL